MCTIFVNFLHFAHNFMCLASAYFHSFFYWTLGVVARCVFELHAHGGDLGDSNNRISIGSVLRRVDKFEDRSNARQYPLQTVTVVIGSKEV